jgi:cobalt-zinc-cadmium efflux system protein
LEDTFGWIAVLIVGGVMWFVTLPVLDSLLSLGITFYILWHVFKNLHETVQVFLQAIPKNINIPELEKILLQQLPIHAIHDWRVWTLDGESNILSFHVIVADNLPNSEIIHLKKQIRYILREHDIQHPTIEIEYENEYCELAEDWGKGISQ